MKSPILKVVVPALALALFTVIGASQASARSTFPSNDDATKLACGTKGAACQGNSDCCSGFSCKDNGGRSCQPD
ncbi:hypothetical protein BH09MYX1_BH09MYX1_26110 [soil metagenome]